MSKKEKEKENSKVLSKVLENIKSDREYSLWFGICTLIFTGNFISFVGSLFIEISQIIQAGLLILFLLPVIGGFLIINKKMNSIQNKSLTRKTIISEGERLIKVMNSKDKEDGEGILKSYVISHDNKALRNDKFKILRNKASESVLIMGIGITHIEPEEIREKYIEKGINVRLLMLNPKILLENFDFFKECKASCDDGCAFSSYKMILKEHHIDDYLRRDEYFGEVELSFKRLKKLVTKLEKIRSFSPELTRDHGKLEMKVFNSFVPMSLTAVNERSNKGEKEFVVEFLLPFSSKRILIPISSEIDSEIYNTFIRSIECLWNESQYCHEIEEAKCRVF